MNIFFTLVQKEWREAWHDKRWIWLPVVISILAISQPLTQYYMPQILDMAGNLPEGTIIEIPVPTGNEVLVSTLGQLGIIGTAIFVLSVMGSIAYERNSGALALVMTRPVHSYQYIASKWMANGVLLLFSFIVGFGLCFYYTNILFERVSFSSFLVGTLLYSLWILFVLSVTLLLGTIFKKTGAIAGTSLLLIAALSVANSLFPGYMEWSPVQAQAQASHYILTGSVDHSFSLMLSSTVLILACLFSLTVISFKRYESI